MGSEYQALTVQSKKYRSSHHRGKHSCQRNNFKNPIDRPKFICYTCDERGHFARDCPRNKSSSHKRNGNKRRQHSHVVEDDEPSTKRTRQDSDDSSSDEEYVLISSLTGTITHGRNDWLIDIGAFKTITGFKESFVKLSEHESTHKVKLEDDY